MNSKVYNTLEFNKIIAMLEGEATSEAARKSIRRLTPTKDESLIRLMQDETADGLTRTVKYGRLSCGGIIDIYALKGPLKSGVVLSSEELLSIAAYVKCAIDAVSYNNSKSDDSTDSLDKYFTQIVPLKDLHREITAKILSPTEIADNASPALRDIRREMLTLGERIRTYMTRQLSSLSQYLQESVITMRGDRFCLSVRAEYKSKVPGMVHDQSSSGQTLFIEPVGAVEMNNTLRKLQLGEEEEIRKILSALSQRCAEHIDELISNYKVLSRLDFIYAKASLALKMNALRPTFTQDGIIDIKAARHPLLDPDFCVPVDIKLGGDYDTLIITGPNTGGKTVTLKTCGLLTLMALSGLFIPAGDGSTIGIFDNVYADIGDEQSIEQSLSTFSSHMTNIVRILRGAAASRGNGHNVLCLFDELCAGTDPSEGAALAIAILKRLGDLGVKTLATTHYSELKLYALSTDNVENASLEFSLETLSATYKLIYGIPGKSNAFDISAKLGLDSTIIEDAKSHITADEISFEDVINDIERSRSQIADDSLDIKLTRERIIDKEKRLDEELRKTQDKKKSILDNANEEAARILESAKKEADEAIRSIMRDKGNSNNIGKLEKTRQNLGKQVKEKRKKTGIEKPVENNNIPKNLHKGDSVKVLSMNKSGTVHTLPDKSGNLQVKMGIMTMNVNIRDLALIKETDPLAIKYGYKADSKKNKSRPDNVTINKTGSVNSKAYNTSYEIKLLGLTSDEAIAALDKYLDDAYLAHISSVRIVHGKGTGVLRQAVHTYLKHHPHVSEYHLGEFGEGDSGVTIASFD